MPEKKVNDRLLLLAVFTHRHMTVVRGYASAGAARGRGLYTHTLDVYVRGVLLAC